MIVVGISGVARAGKDTFCNLLIEELAKQGVEGKRFALADELKADMNPFFIEKFNTDIFFPSSPEEKELMRPLLVDYGKVKRILSQGKHWTSLLEAKIKSFSGVDVAIVTDVRYDIYPEDELFWLKQQMKGVLVHVSRYTGIDQTPIERLALNDGTTAFVSSKKFIEPPNADEALNDPRIKMKADYHVEWATGDIEKYCRPEVKQFLQYMAF